MSVGADDAGLCQVSCSACELAEAAVSNRRAGRASWAFAMPAVHVGGAHGGSEATPVTMNIFITALSRGDDSTGDLALSALWKLIDSGWRYGFSGRGFRWPVMMHRVIGLGAGPGGRAAAVARGSTDRRAA